MRSFLLAATVTALSLATPAWADSFFFTTGTIDGLVGAASQFTGANSLETETADDFILTDATSIAQASVIGLIPVGTPVGDLGNVEVEVYHVFPKDSVNPPSGNVTSRANSPSDVEIAGATRDGNLGTLGFSATLLNPNFSVSNSVVNGIFKKPNSTTLGEGPVTGELVEITITFTPPIVLPPDHYFFRPEVEVAGGDFLFLSAPRPIVPPGTPLAGEAQAWIRNSDLKPDWLRIGTDIIGGNPVRTLNMALSLTGETIPQAGTPREANCHGTSVSAMAHQFGSFNAAASALGFSSVGELHNAVRAFCEL